MREKVIRRLIKIVEESNIESLEYKNWAGSIRITKKLPNGSNGAGVSANLTTYPAAPAAGSSPFVSVPPAEDKLVPIKSPMVGTFYRAPAPDARPYVELGDVVEPGQVVCIIEAMKLMNEIESEVKGKIVKIPAESGKPVEFGQALFLIEPI